MTREEPRTKAGRELKDTMRLWFFTPWGELDDEAFNQWWPLILAIEREAAEEPLPERRRVA